MQCYGLIGRHLSHSFSKTYFQAKFEREQIDARFDNFDVESDALSTVLQQPNLIGCSVTMPYKHDILQHIVHVTQEAKIIGAVNCIRKDPKGWIGHNTDWIGFDHVLQLANIEPGTKAIVLGNGGAAKAVLYVLRKWGIPFISVTRRMEPHTIHYADIDANILQEYRLVINTTPLGMHPQISTFPPLPYHLLNQQHMLMDLIYNPHETLFLVKGKAQGATVYNGREMLRIQAEAAWAFWQNKPDVYNNQS